MLADNFHCGQEFFSPLLLGFSSHAMRCSRMFFFILPIVPTYTHQTQFTMLLFCANANCVYIGTFILVSIQFISLKVSFGEVTLASSFKYSLIISGQSMQMDCV
uniref:Uncharacterized protein n=1 Tax=Cacopsylla melanoneura TaxID=428564 RepID=A0A8D8W2E6_9HEMI